MHSRVEGVGAVVRLLSGRYELLEPLGRGGMGVVYRARDRQLERIVAVKVLPAGMLHDGDFRARFLREARAAAGLSHPNIAVVHDTGEDSGAAEPVPYLVMELVEGLTLAELLRRTPPAANEAGQIVVAVLAALEHSHGRGVVHRDIKPANIMVHRADGRVLVKVMDFGIAKLMSETVTRLTATGARIGTPSYMSPEQADGKPADARSDLYSVGCVLYEMLTGRPPFTGDSPTIVLFGHLHKTPPPPSQLNPDLAPLWDQILVTALAKDPRQRHRDAAAMRQAIETGSAPTARAPSPAPPPVSGNADQATADPDAGNRPPDHPMNGPPGVPKKPGRASTPDPADAPRSYLLGRRSLTVLAAAVCLSLLAGGGWITWDQLHDSPPQSKPRSSTPAPTSSEQRDFALASELKPILVTFFPAYARSDRTALSRFSAGSPIGGLAGSVEYRRVGEVVAPQGEANARTVTATVVWRGVNGELEQTYELDMVRKDATWYVKAIRGTTDPAPS